MIHKAYKNQLTLCLLQNEKIVLNPTPPQQAQFWELAIYKTLHMALRMLFLSFTFENCVC